MLFNFEFGDSIYTKRSVPSEVKHRHERGQCVLISGIGMTTQFLLLDTLLC
jgi:hypothetical protein